MDFTKLFEFRMILPQTSLEYFGQDYRIRIFFQERKGFVTIEDIRKSPVETSFFFCRKSKLASIAFCRSLQLIMFAYY